MRIRNWRPSSTNRKCRIAANTASSSLSNVEYFDSGTDNFLLKKARGCHDPEESCCKTPPMCVSDASAASEITAPGSGCASAVAEMSAALAAQKAAAAESDQLRDLGLPRSRSVSGCRIPAIPGKNW